MGNLYKNIQLVLDFLKTPFLVLHFSYYRLIPMAFLMMLSVILLYMLIILVSDLVVIRHLICASN